MQQGYTIKLKESNDVGATYEVTITVPMSEGWLEDMFMVTQSNHGNKSFKLSFDHNEDGYVIFKNDVFLYTSAIYRYYFTFTANSKRKYMNVDQEVVDYMDYRKYDKLSVNFEVPEWAKGAIMYHIFVDRFNRGSDKPLEPIKGRVIKNWDDPVTVPYDADWDHDFYGGDLKGITDKLNYIKDLGVDIIYLSPIVTSPKNHRYDAADYENVDPYVGTNNDLKVLCDEAHKRNIKIILDGVFDHTGNDSKYFNEYGNYPNIGAKQDINSYYGSFYKTWYNSGNTYFDYWFGFQDLPVCDGNSKNWQEYIYGKGGIIDQWFELGIDGLRLDVADNLYDEFLEGIRTAVKRNKKDGLIIGEVWKNAMHENRGYISNGKCMDTQMNYPLVDALMRYFKFTDVSKLSGVIQDMLNEYPKDTLNTLMNFTSTHDITRVINIFGSDDFREYLEYAWTNLFQCHENPDYFNNFKLTPEEYQKGKDIFEAYSFCMNFMPGIFAIFYGDEIGMTGMGNHNNRCPMTWDKIDEELLNYFKYLGQIRKEQTFLKEADLKMVDINHHYMMFERLSNEGDALVTINRTNEDYAPLIPERYETNDKIYTLKKSQMHRLSPYGCTAIIKK